MLGVSLYISMYICIIIWFGLSPLFSFIS
jgi:hypothetical protein